MQDQVIKDIINGKKRDRTDRYNDIKKIMDQAIEGNVDILVMPEAYVPIDYLPLIQAKAAAEQMLVICGIEHIVNKNKVYNITATLIPFEKKYSDGGNYSVKYTIPFFHQKQFFSPYEMNLVDDNLTVALSNGTPLFIWNDIAFTSFCCFELTSLELRSKYLGHAEIVFAVEWNKDTNYFSRIIESYCRDAYCYCVQVNMSEYGDTRIIRPTREIEKDIVKVKGGDNAIVLIDSIDINKLKKYREFGVPNEEDSYKPLPAGWNKK